MTGMRPWRGFWSGTWRRRGGLNGHRLTLEVFLIGVVFVAVPYFSTNNIAEAYLSTVFDPEIALDRQIPYGTGRSYPMPCCTPSTLRH